jgi:putative colanic acid biosynthesis acetyltransferase WcaF
VQFSGYRFFGSRHRSEKTVSWLRIFLGRARYLLVLWLRVAAGINSCLEGEMAVDLSSFRKNKSIPGRGLGVQILWAIAGLPLLRSTFLIGSCWRVALLRIFGAKIGSNVSIKSGVRVKYPWKLQIGMNSWIGEDCWIDNMAIVTLGSNVCLSQGSYLCTGNHNWKDRSFPMSATPITLEDGSWVASRCTLGPGVRIGRNAIAALGSVVCNSIPADQIHAGNPASFRCLRSFDEPETCCVDPEVYTSTTYS